MLPTRARYAAALMGLAIFLVGLIAALIDTGPEKAPIIALRVILILGAVAMTVGIADEWLVEMKADRARR